MQRYWVLLLGLFVYFITLTANASYCASSKPEVQAYIDTLVKKHHFNRERLDSLFCSVVMNDEVIQKLSKPAEAKPWYEYRRLVITPEKISKGLAYWHAHEKTLKAVEKKYHVPASVIVAIIGVETKYGEVKGNYPVFNTLVTLGFNNGRRANYFRSELTQYLLLARENNFKPLVLKGSYAGAVGLPQFMPSSYRQYAVDFNHKGWADLFEDDADAIASIANYLKKHGWNQNEQIALRAIAKGDSTDLIKKSFKPTLTESDLEAHGIRPESPYNINKCSLFQLEEETGIQYWLGLQNFYCITTYNNSALYAMAVRELADKLIKGRSKPHNQEVAVNLSPEDTNEEEI
jgi:membrane-bound lytic murein transglycosylase B